METFTVIVFTKDGNLPLKYRNVKKIVALMEYVRDKLKREPEYCNLYDKNKKFVRRVHLN